MREVTAPARDPQCTDCIVFGAEDGERCILLCGACEQRCLPLEQPLQFGSLARLA